MENLNFTKEEQVDITIELASNFITKAEATFEDNKKVKFLAMAKKSIDKAMDLLAKEE